jgi:hypothetical protein
MERSFKNRIELLCVFLLIFIFNALDGNLSIVALNMVCLPMIGIVAFPLIMEKYELWSFKRKMEVEEQS